MSVKKAVFLYNTESGKGRIAREAEAICAIFRDGGYDIEPRRIDFAVNPFDGYETIDLMVAAGGDGTVNYVLNAMKRKGLDIPVGVIPAGTANDFSGAVGMPRDPLEAARQIAGGEVERVDCGCVNGLWFVNVFSFGIFTTTSQRTSDERKHRFGKLAYLFEGARELRTMHAVPLRVKTDDGEFRFDALMALISTARRPEDSVWRGRRRSATDCSTASCWRNGVSCIRYSPCAGICWAAIPAPCGVSAPADSKSRRRSTSLRTWTDRRAPVSRSASLARRAVFG